MSAKKTSKSSNASITTAKVQQHRVEVDGLVMTVEAREKGFTVDVFALPKKTWPRSRKIMAAVNAIPGLMWSRGETNKWTAQFDGKFKPAYLEKLVSAAR